MNISFSSTRASNKVSPSEAILKGISEEGGLFVPDFFPKVDVKNLINLTYQDICFEILSKYLIDFNSDELKGIIYESYSKFTHKKIAPLVNFDKAHILELFHGPTLAFKDVALSILPYLMKYSAKIQNIDEEIVILTATSGDTGKAALEGFANVENTKIIVFYPNKGVSKIQKQQMVSQEGDNVYVIGIDGNFDDAQNGVKYIFNDQSYKAMLKDNNIILSSANSINIGRLLPQIVYYFSSYLQLVDKDMININDEVNFTVPTGNFGNILAGYYAKKMGLPINKLICASNSNNVLYDFLKTGVYNKNRRFIKTMSPSMDILISSNFERLLYHMSGNDKELIKDLMAKLNNKGSYQISEEIKSKIDELFYGNYCDEFSTEKCIKEVYQTHNYVMDTHTAVAYKVYKDYVFDTQDDRHNIILSTASPFKFTKSVYNSIFGQDSVDEYALINKLSEKTNISIPVNISLLENLPILHQNVIPSDGMKKCISELLL